MRIMYVAYSGLPSTTAQSINVARACSALAELGHEVSLLVPSAHPMRLHERTDLFRFYNLPENFSIQYVTAPKGRLGRTIFTWKTALEARRWRPDLVMSRYLKSGLLCARLGFPVIYELHAPIKGKGRVISKLARTGQLRSLVTHTNEILREVRGHHLPGLADERVYAIPNGRNPLAGTVAAKTLPKTTGGLNIGYVGKLQAQKGLDLIRALAPLLPGHDIHIVGGDETQIAQWRPQLDLPNVHFHGYVPQAEVDAYIAALDVCLLPNEPHPENPAGVLYSSPMKVLDYMAHGKAILASDLAEIREMLDSDEAMLLPQGDAPAWAEAIARLDGARLEALGETARKRLVAEFSMQARYRRILEHAGFTSPPTAG